MNPTINQLFSRPLLTDGGLETTLIFQHGIDLPHFAAFDLLLKPRQAKVLAAYYREYLELAKKHHTGFVLESATWRANPDWAYKLGYSDEQLVDINQLAIRQLQALKKEYQKEIDPILISGCLGPRSDGYQVAGKMTVTQAEAYHDLQIGAFKHAGVDLVSALTINYVEEGLGIVQAAKKRDLPVVISLTVETDGVLPSGASIQEAIEQMDKASDQYPWYYMLNCAHPSHFAQGLVAGSKWVERIVGIRANASCKSHAELDEATELDAGNKEELAVWYKDLQATLPNLKVYGGCCGTDVGHLEAICTQCVELASSKMH